MSRLIKPTTKILPFFIEKSPWDLIFTNPDEIWPPLRASLSKSRKLALLRKGIIFEQQIRQAIEI